MSTVFARLAAIRDYWMPRDEDARGEVRVADIDAILNELVRVTTLAADRGAELETERIRLAACGVVALSNTPDAAATARTMRPEYRSASLDDVESAVDEQMRLRTALAEAQKDAARWRKFDGMMSEDDAELYVDALGWRILKAALRIGPDDAMQEGER